MNWVGLAGLVAAVRTPLQVAVLTYIGAGGIAGVAVVSVVLLTPAGQVVVQQAIEPARELVQNILPADFPFTVAFDPRQELASPAAVRREPVAIGTQKSLGFSAPEPAVDDLPSPPVDDPSLVASSLPASQSTFVRPSQVSQSSPPVPRIDAGEPAAGVGVNVALPLAVLPARAVVPASVLAAAPRPVEVPAAEPVVPTAVALATARPARVEVRSVAANLQVAATVPLPTPVPDRSTPSRPRNDVSAVTPEPTRVAPTAVIEPARVPPTLAPVVKPTAVPVVVPTDEPTRVPVPTQMPAPTQLPAATQVPAPTAIRLPPTKVPEDEKTPVPTSRPTQTPVPTRAATQTPVPVKSPTPRPTVKPTAVPSHAPATATPVKGKPEPEPTEPSRERERPPSNVPPKG